MQLESLKNEDGFWSAIFVLLVVVLGGLALSTNFAARRDMENTTNNTLSMQLDYSVNAAAYYAIKEFRDGNLTADGETSVTVGDIDCSIFCDRVQEEDLVYYTLDIEAVNDKGLRRNVIIEIENATDFAGKAINCEGTAASNVQARVEGGSVHDPDLIVDETPLPEIHIADLIAAANVVVTSRAQLIDGFPANMTAVCAGNPFYQADCVTPNIIFVAPGVGINMTGGGGWRVINGIFITDGDLDTNGGHTEVNGVVLLTSPPSNVTMRGTHGGRYHILGGVVSYGDVGGTGWPWIEHKREYMEHFAQYVEAGLESAAILAWRYE